MRLKLGDWDVNARVDDESSRVSRHTGQSLLNREVTFVVRGEDTNDQVSALLQKARDQYFQSLDEKGQPEKTWRVGDFSSSHRDDEIVFTYKVDLQEIDVLTCTALIIDDLDLGQPYAYAETERDQEVVIEAKVRVGLAQHERLKELEWGERDVVAVVRRGVNEEPIRMRFALCYWSKDGEFFKHKLTLVEAVPDDLTRPVNQLSTAFLWTHNLRNQAVRSLTLIEALLDTLVQKGVISSDELEALRQQAKEHRIDTTYEVFKVEDVDLL